MADAAYQRAFNGGSDARLALQNRTDNPYPTESDLWLAWDRGWDHCDREWGVEAKWPLQVLAQPLRRNTAGS